MRCGILIVGSLFWDDDTERADWRARRLDADASMRVRAPIYYGRKSGSRGDTYTMTFRQEAPHGMAVLVPCRRRIESIDDLKAEAGALWKAEAPKSPPGAIGSKWGCVGVLIGSHKAGAALAGAWRTHFQQAGRQGLSAVKGDGILDIPWPECVNGEPVDIDIILATATMPETEPPPAHVVADAWIDQNGGYERYFLENVRHGIRTPDDGDIWKRVEERAPEWLKSGAYSQAIEILQKETAGRQ